MTITEIIRFYALRTFTPYSAFVYKCLPARRTTADWWTVTFGGPADDSDAVLNIGSMLELPNTFYSSVNSIADAQSQNKSFYWDAGNQILYVHIDQSTLPVKESFSNGATFGYTDSDVIYIDGIEYLPLLQSVPSLSRQADLASYDQMAFISGAMQFDNTGGAFDSVINDDIYGNDVFVYYLDAVIGVNDYTHNDLVPISSLYIEDYDFDLETFTLNVQDQRKSHNSDILSEFYNDDESSPVPLLYGPIEAIEPTQTSDDSVVAVSYRVGTILTALGTIECEGDYGWQETTPISYDLATGTFVLSATYARAPGNGLGETDGAILPCRVRNCVGIANTSALDIIKHINDSVLGVPYTASNYDIDAWDAASALVAPIGIAFTDQMAVYDAITMIQNGCNIGFRYEVDATGLRTIKIDDWEAEPTRVVTRFDIKDNLTFKVSTDSSLIAAKVAVNYKHNLVEDTYTSYVDDSQYDNVLLKYRQVPTLSIDTYLLTEAPAIQRAEFALERYSSIIRTAEVTLHGKQWYDLAIYDIIELELSSDSRLYFGTWIAQVISVDPQFESLSTKISAILIRRA